MDNIKIKPKMEGGLEKPTRHVIDWKNPDFLNEEKALDCLESFLVEQAIDQARDSGAANIVTKVSRDIKKAKAEAREMFVEAIVTVEASGRPRIS